VFPLEEEFFETCKYAIRGDREFLLKARPSDTYYMEEEVTPLSSCDAKFSDTFDKKQYLRSSANLRMTIATKRIILGFIFFVSR